MRVIAKSTLRAFWTRHPQAEVPLRTWYVAVSHAFWNGPSDVKTMFGGNVDFVRDNRIIFDIGGNKYRLIIHADYAYKRVLIKFIGTHSQYDRIDSETV